MVMNETIYRSTLEVLCNRTPKDVPERPSQVDQEYDIVRNLPFQTKKEATSKIFERYQDYFIKKWDIELFNRDTFIMLYDELLISRKEERDKINSKLLEFKNKILLTKNSYVALRIDFTKYKFKEPGREEVDWHA